MPGNFPKGGGIKGVPVSEIWEDMATGESVRSSATNMSDVPIPSYTVNKKGPTRIKIKK